MEHPRYSFKTTLLWEFSQFLFFSIFIITLYIEETSLIYYISKEGINQQIAIHNFLNKLQLSFLPKFFYFLFFHFMIISISLIVFKRYRWYFLGLMGMIISALLIADKFYYMFFSTILSTVLFKTISHAWSVKSFLAKSIAKSINYKDLLCIFKYILFIIFGYFFNKNIRTDLRSNPLSFSIDKCVGIIFFLLALYCYKIAFYLPSRYVALDNNNNNLIISLKPINQSGIPTSPDYKLASRHYAATFGILNFHAQNIMNYFFPQNENLIITHQESIKIKELFDHKKVLNHMSSPLWGIAKGRNIFLIQVESLNPIFINFSIGNESITPNFNKLLQDGLYWNYIIDQASRGGSSDSEFSVLTGMLPDLSDMIAFNHDIMKKLPALPRYLKDKGYMTISLHGFNSSFYQRNINHPILGFEKMYFEKTFLDDQKLGWGLPDQDFFLQSADMLSGCETPFFAFLITLSTHYPYLDVPPQYSKLYDGTLNPDSTFIRYLRLLRYTDDALGAFLDKIKKENLWSNSMFIIYGDHKPVLEVNPHLDGKPYDELKKISGKSLQEPRSQCVPVLILIPGKEKFIRENKQKYDDIVGGLYDLFPTILHLTGFEIPFGVYGTHLFVPNDHRDVVPTIRYSNGFVLNGILYQGVEAIPAQDDYGYVYINNADAVLKNRTDRIKAYKESRQLMNLMAYLYHSKLEVDE